MLRGAAAVSNGDQIWQVEAGDALLWPKDMARHILTRSGAHWLSLGLEVNAPGPHDLLKLLPLPAHSAPSVTERAWLQSWMENMACIRSALAHDTPEKQRVARSFETDFTLEKRLSYDQWVNRIVEQRPSYYDAIEAGLARAVFGLAWKLWATLDLERALNSQAPPWLQQTLELMRRNPALSVSELSRAAGFSPAQFRRSFREHTGQSPRDYLQSQRLNFARQLLERTDVPVAEIAAKTGFSSVPHFIDLWKRTHGLSPLQFRISSKAGQI